MAAHDSSVNRRDEAEWARACRIEAARTTHAQTRDLLLMLAAEYEGLAGKAVDLHPDDHDVQSAVADRLQASAARFRSLQKRKLAE